ncbi:MAG: hypothetical protein FWH22_11195, partial [Fibromonadales bacterium]|nr:hypothetical protein [Fibromonadales bacterium]
FDNSILSEFYIDYATLTLNNEIAEFFGQILFDAVPNSTEAEKGCVYAKKPTKRELLNMFLLRPIGKRPKHYCHSFNDEIAMLLCSNTSRKLIAFYNKHYNSLLGKLARKIFPEPVPIPWLNKSGEVIETLKARNFKMIMIYGSGKIGMEMIREVKKNKLTVAGISDKNYSKMKNVINPNELLNHKFDVIFVCIANKAVSAQAKMELLALGIENNRIVEYANPPSTPQSAVSRCQ